MKLRLYHHVDGARIVAVAEVYDTLTARGSYRTPMSSRLALAELERVSGSQLDPTHVAALGDVLRELVLASDAVSASHRHGPMRLVKGGRGRPGG